MVTVAEIAERYPSLWHMSDPRNLPSILDRGLLSTRRLLEVVGLPVWDIEVRERQHRSDDVLIADKRYGVVVLRDQKPLNLTRLSSVLIEGTVAEFLRSVNRRVFFWPTEKRLATLSGARAYRGRMQIVLIAATLPLLRRHEPQVRLSRINSGAAMRSAPPRSAKTFEWLDSYDWSAMRRHVAEVTIEDDVTDIWQYVERCEVWRDGARIAALEPPFDRSLVQRVNQLQTEV